MSETPIFIVGCTPFAAMVANYFANDRQREVIGFAVHERFLTGSTFSGRPLSSIEKLTLEIPPGTAEYFAALEYKWLNDARRQMLAELSSAGYSAATFIHPLACVAPNSQIGAHCLIMEGAILSDGCIIGDNNILFPQVFLGTSARLGSSNYLAPRACVDRYAVVGDHCVLGRESSVTEGVKVGSWSYVKPRFEVESDLASGTMINASLRSIGTVIDRRRSETPI